MQSIPSRKSKATLELYSEYGALFGNALRKLFDFIRFSKKSIDPYDLETMFVQACHRDGVEFVCPSEQNENLERFDNVLCVSVNDTVAHGRERSLIKLGDVVSIDTAIAYASGASRITLDAAFTIECGIGHMMSNSWWLRPLEALKAIKEKNLLDTEAISSLIFQTARQDPGLGVVSALCGHGIGKRMHEPPYIHNAPSGEVSVRLINGMCFCPEPIYVKENYAFSDIILEDDGWSISTVSGKPATHFETTFGVVNDTLVDFVGLTDWPTY
jgi:methionine aminopeptidase